MAIVSDLHDVLGAGTLPTVPGLELYAEYRPAPVATSVATGGTSCPCRAARASRSCSATSPATGSPRPPR